MTSLALKPHLLRADTIDLQSHENPSAKDHTGGQFHSAYNNHGPNPGSHHTQALRNANQDAYQEMHTSPRLGGFDHNHNGPHAHMHMYDEGDEDDEDDIPADGMNGHHDGAYDDGNDSQDEDMDDELLDKISSSPSIEDGKQPWPTRADSLRHGLVPSPGAVPTRGISLYPSILASCSPHSSPKASRSHQTGPLNDRQASPDQRQDIKVDSMPKFHPTDVPVVPCKPMISLSNSIDDISRHLLPLEDPFLDDIVGDVLDQDDFEDDDPDWIDDDIYNEWGSSDDDHADSAFTTDSRFIDSGWGGECLRELEDIDFEFVYALHTFVATVEGQANATKGETMVLLDDSNSYWWLVRVVKDGSIGYLPAEHIETPTERLARLNKHRNIDLAAAMLGDNPERTKNPLKKAMRRRNAKTVNFAPPTYYDADERVWSDEEDEEDDGEDVVAAHMENSASQDDQQAQRAQQNTQAQQTQQVIQTVEPQKVQPVTATIHRVESNEDMDDGEPLSPTKSDGSISASSQNTQDPVKRSRTGVVRNTDSFFRDDTVETKKISLTPRLLRNDADSTTPAETEVKPRTSIDTFDKVIGEDKSKETKKKEKKGMLSGLFKRKDKGAKGGKSDNEESDRLSEESRRSPQSKESAEEIGGDRKPGKLQKPQPSLVSPKASPTETRTPHRDFGSSGPQQGGSGLPKNQLEAAQATSGSANLAPEPQPQPSRFPSLQDKRSVFAPITGALRSKTSSQDMADSAVKPIYSKRAKERFAIDDSDSDDGSTPTAQSSLHRSISPLEYNGVGNGRPNSDMRVSPVDVRDDGRAQKMGTPISNDGKERPGPSQQTNSTASPTTPSDQTVSTSKHSPSVATHTPSTSRSTPTWSDASLRSYMDNDQDIRDLLVIVHDKTNIIPVGNEHPLMNGLFASERNKLADMQTQLDSMLLSWLSKKNTSLNGGMAGRV